MMRKTGIVALGAIAALALAGCSGSAEGASDDASAEIRVWLVGTDTPDEARSYLKETFEEENPGSTLVIEEQQWNGLVDKYTTALSGSDSPDVVEIGNTQAAAFTSAGAFTDLTDKYDELGGDSLLQGFVEAGTYEDKIYAYPYYSGARVVFYTPQIFGGEVPTTLDEYVDAGIAMKEAGTASGIYAPGKDWYNVLPFVWENGGYVAEQQDDGTWKAGFSSDGGVAGLEQMQSIYTSATSAPKDGDETNAQVPFCEGDVGFLSAPSWFQWSLKAEADADTPGCPDTYGKDVTAFALPGKDGGAAAAFAGGSNIAVAATSAHRDLAYKALQIMLSPDYQELLAAKGLIPATSEAADALPDDEVTAAAAAAAENARLTPAAPKWADVEASEVIKNALVKIAQGGDVTTIATNLDAEIEEILNS
ncbi:extracellular solute-binding protein [Paramicrobacterium chengjingii]|uniref:Extracellular solute-binding protein n=1 Tax=Paramicrobacterium chengjingii TaxID=2769067 RepID=A0ABX6YLL2_9MICO|nr:extracellular solute-binding protein [Microbacterium chengjingii]QPZ39225.1 extracellular solute-binding protein [Microbacterium chengjingii]